MKPLYLLLALPLLTAATWYGNDYNPYIVSTADGTRMRLYGATRQDYADITIVYHGSMTKELAFKQIKPSIHRAKKQ